MTKLEAIFKAYSGSLFNHLTLDDMLIVQNVSHKRYRNWLHNESLPLPAVSVGLVAEITDTFEGSRMDLAKEYHLDYLEANNCMYGDRTFKCNHMKKESASHLRQHFMQVYKESSEYTPYIELEIIKRGLPPCLDRLSDELTARRNEGESAKELAELYGYTPGRISQLDKGKRHNVRIKGPEREAIRNSSKSAAQLAKQYKCTVNTIHVIRREGTE